MSDSRVKRLERESLEALDHDILVIPEPEPHDVQHACRGRANASADLECKSDVARPTQLLQIANTPSPFAVAVGSK
jgi:hypothetical protein